MRRSEKPHDLPCIATGLGLLVSGSWCGEWPEEVNELVGLGLVWSSYRMAIRCMSP